MKHTRDDFTAKTKEILAKRVGYLCSNPDCRRPTIGANLNDKNTISIGVASHITAASPGGKRYNLEISESERTSIENGIWLCASCATLIDRDEITFSVEVLNIWRDGAELESFNKLRGLMESQKDPIPFPEVDLIWSSSGRWHRGYSPKNVQINHEGKQVYLFHRELIVYWDLNWDYKFVIYNNSTTAILNLKLESIGSNHFTRMTNLENINSIPPYQNIELDARFEFSFEGTANEADSILEKHIPDNCKDVILRLSYLDGNRQQHSTIIKFENNVVRNEIEN